MLILAFDTATDVATSALVDGDEVLAERRSRAQTLLEDVDALLRQGGAHPSSLNGLAVGVGPGSFTGVRIGLAAARGLALSLDLRGAGVSTLDALAAGAAGGVPAGRAGRGRARRDAGRRRAPARGVRDGRRRACRRGARRAPGRRGQDVRRQRRRPLP